MTKPAWEWHLAIWTWVLVAFIVGCVVAAGVCQSRLESAHEAVVEARDNAAIEKTRAVLAESQVDGLENALNDTTARVIELQGSLWSDDGTASVTATEGSTP